MNTDRRSFLKGMAIAGATAAIGAKGASAAEGGLVDLPVPAGKEFVNMGGAFSAMITPFTKENRVNEAEIERIVEFGIRSGLKGFYLTGSTGEGMLMSPEERATVIRRVVKTAKGRVKIIAHVGAVGTDESLVNVRNAADAGVDWLSAIGPVFFGKNFNGTYDYYRRLSNETNLPFMVYALNTGIVPDRDVKMFDLPNVKGMKYTGHSVWDIERLRQRIQKDVVFFGGADEQNLAALSLRSVFNGCIGTSQNMIPRHFVELCSAVAKGDLAEAARLQDEIVRFVDVMLSKPDNNGSWYKAMMSYVGFEVGSARSPLGWPLTDAERAGLYRKLDALGFVKKINA